MSTQDIVNEFIQRQRREGGVEMLAQVVARVYTRRFGALPADVAALIVKTHEQAKLEAWLDLAYTGSAEDLPNAVRSQSSS